MTDYGLSQQQIAVICALSSGATITAAAQASDVHRNTINNWRRNSIAFQHAFAHAQYDRALHYREKLEGLMDIAVESLQAILTDPNASPSVRLKAALAVIQTVTTPPAPKKQVALDIEKLTIRNDPPQTVNRDLEIVHNNAQSTPATAPAETTVAAPRSPQSVHNAAQVTPQHVPPRRVLPKVGRNEACPCGSGKKYKRCCIDGAVPPLATAA